ncbi:rhodanese-like domain-containing protein [Zhongshania sp.]|jgi:phage shock protein E|uniref:rhodanese-like domain-containing protein n=1 Tax=Zhongshania sp. TaxID=1971902 RepID=UPI0039E59F8D
MNWRKLISCCVFFIIIPFSLFSYADPVWIDVRSAGERMIDNIEGDIRISHGEIVAEISKLVSDKDTEISLYCRSGGRASEARSALLDAGYTNVSNVGGINDARKARGLSEAQ